MAFADEQLQNPGAAFNADLSTPTTVSATKGAVTTAGKNPTVLPYIGVDIFSADLETETSAFTTEFDSKTCAGSNTLTIASSPVHYGAAAAKTTFDGTNDDAYAVTSITSSTEVFGRFYLRINSDFEHTSTSTWLGMFRLRDDTYYKYLFNLFIASLNPKTTFEWVVRAWDGSTDATIYQGGTVTKNVWHLVEWHWKAGSGSDGGLQVKINGSSVCSVFTYNIATSRANVCWVGAMGSGTAPLSASEAYWDDVALDSSDWIGTSPTYLETPATIVNADNGAITVAGQKTTVNAKRLINATAGTVNVIGRATVTGISTVIPCKSAPATITAYGAVVSPYRAVDLFSSSLETETNDFTTEFDGKTVAGSNTITVVTSPSNYGAKATRSTYDGTNDDAYAYTNITNSSECYGRVFVRINSDFEHAGVGSYHGFTCLLDYRDGFWDELVKLFISSVTDTTTFKWIVYVYDGSTWQTLYDGGTVTKDTWHCLEWHWKAGTGANGGVEVKINGASVGSVWTYNLASSYATLLRIGGQGSGTSPTTDSELYIDDVAVHSVGWIGTNPTYYKASTTVSAAAATVIIAGYDVVVTVPGPTVVSCTAATVTVAAYDAQVGGFVYYVRADGSAANKGAATSDAAASTSMSISTHNGETFAPGDTIIISDAGGIYRGTTLNTPSSGAAGVPIRYEASGTPDMRGSQLVTGWTVYSGSIYQATVTTEPQQVWANGTFGDRKTGTGSMTNEYDWYWASNVLYLYAPGDPDTQYTSPGVEAGAISSVFKIDADYIQVDGLIFRHGNGNNLHCQVANHVLVTNCISEWGWITGYRTDNNTESVPFEDVVFEDCIGRYCGGHGFLLNTNHNNCTVRRCDAYENGRYQGEWEPIEHDFTGGIKCWGNQLYITGYTVEYCRSWSNGPASSSNSNLGVGIWIDQSLGTSGARNTLRYNLVWDCNAYGIFIEVSSYADVHHNIVWESARASFSGSISLKGWGNQNVSYNRIYNNTVYKSYWYDYQNETYTAGGESPQSNYNKFYNNISSGNQSSYQSIYFRLGGGNDGTYGTGNEYYNNCWGTESSNYIHWNTTDYSTIAAWETAASGAAVDNIAGDPKLKDPDNEKFYLQSDSPCIDAGYDLGADFDDGIDPRILTTAWPDAVVTLDQDLWGTGWEVGAYVYDYVTDVGAVALAGKNAVINEQTNVFCSGNVWPINVLGYATVVTVFEGVTVDCTLGTVAVLGRQPEVEVEREVLVAAAGAVTVTAFDAVITLPWIVLVSSGAVTVAALQPEIVLNAKVFATKGAVAVLGKKPTVTVGLETIVPCTKGAVAVAKFNATIASEITTKVTVATTGAVAITKHNATIASEITTKVSATKGVLTISGINPLISLETAVLASTGVLFAKAVGAPWVWYTTKVSAARGAVSVAPHNAKVSIVKDAVPATLGAVTVAAVSPAFAMPDWYPKRIEAQSKPITILGKAASIIAPIIATALGTVAVTGYTAEIHQGLILASCNKGSVAVAGYGTLIGTKVNVSSKGAVTVTGYDAAGTISAIAKATKGALTVNGHDTIVNALAVWATQGDVLVVGHDPFVVAPFAPGFGVVVPTQTSKNYITYYQEWANHFPAEIARRWRQFLVDTFFIATPATVATGTGNSIELTTDVEITEHTIGQAWRFIAAYTNTGGTILDVNGIGPQTVHYADAPLKGGEIVAGGSYEVVYDGNAWNLTSSSRAVVGLGARTWLSADQELTHDTLEPIVWSQTALYDDDGFFYHGGGGIESVIIPADGRYKITGLVLFRCDAVIAEFQTRVELALNGELVQASRVSGRVEEAENDLGVTFEYSDLFVAGDEIILWVSEWNNMSENAYAQGHSNHRNASWWAIERLR